ncbi:hypothetical protein D3C87_298630 [compost metagenome]
MAKEWVSVEFDDGAMFFMDFLQRQLRECNNPGNVMRLDDMVDKGTHYEFLYDPTTNNIASEGRLDGPNPDDPYRVSLKQMSQWDLRATAHIFHMEESDFRGMTDKEFFKLPYVAELKNVTDNLDPRQVALLEDRLKGALPEIKIGHEMYEVDWANKQLHCLNENGKRINLSTMDMNADGTEYICFYNQRHGIVADPKFQQQHYPDLVMLSIPYELKLDPVGVARQYGLKDYDLLEQHPIQEKLEAKLTPVYKQRQMQLQHKTNKLKNKKNGNRLR